MKNENDKSLLDNRFLLIINLIFLIFLLTFTIQFTSATTILNATTSSYNIEKFHQGSVGGNSTTSSYDSFTFTTTYEQPGSSNGSTSSFFSNIGWFDVFLGKKETIVVTPSVSSGGTTSGGGGGGGSPTLKTEKLTGIKVIPTSFNLPATVGIIGNGKLTIISERNNATNLKINVETLDKEIVFKENEIILGSGETKNLDFDIIPPNEPGIYTGKIIISDVDKNSLEIPFTLNVKSKSSLFDILIDLSDEYKIIKQGQRIPAQITLVQAGLEENVDVRLVYLIKDFEGNNLFEESETIAINKQKTFQHIYKTDKLKEGSYIVGVEVIYSGGVATASHQFEVSNEKIPLWKKFILAEVIAGISILLIIIILIITYKRKISYYNKKRRKGKLKR